MYIRPIVSLISDHMDDRFGDDLGCVQMYHVSRTLAPPDALHALVVDVPALGSQQCRDPTVAITAVLARQADDRCPQRLLVRSHHGSVVGPVRVIIIR